MAAIREKGRKGLAWFSFVLAAVGGAAVAVTFVGGIIAGILGFFWWWTAPAALLAAVALIVRDLWMDGEPNFIALFSAMAIPSLARAAPGRFGNAISDASGKILAQADRAMGEWFGTLAPIGIAGMCILVSLLLGQRMVSRNAGRTASLGGRR